MLLIRGRSRVYPNIVSGGIPVNSEMYLERLLWVINSHFASDGPSDRSRPEAAYWADSRPTTLRLHRPSVDMLRIQRFGVQALQRIEIDRRDLRTIRHGSVSETLYPTRFAE